MLWVKILTGVAIAAGTAAVLFAALSAVTYFIVFFSPKKGQNVDLSIPDGANYKRYGDVPKDMIIEAASVPFESVETTARDGTRLTGRLYAAWPIRCETCATATALPRLARPKTTKCT
ncbi:MAG: hypothetical protein J6X47_05695 [Clostridia bacterium]|nr:hypothetical protein [Clostridia bacterium]